MPRAELYVGELLMKLMARETGEISKVDFNPQKKAFNSLPFPDETFLERRSPESQGVSSAFFHDLIKELSDDRECLIHKIMFLRHGFVVAECAFEPYELDMWHVTYSMCKSITGMAVGILVGEGRLSVDDRVSDIFSAHVGPFSRFKRNVTVKNLLNMTSGVEFNEAGAVSGNDWRKGFLESSFKFEPGTRFEYNSMNSYMLSAIVTEITGQSLSDFCRERIFDPMGIKRFFWESCPQSITKGGWGLFMRAEDMAKMGQLYLQEGKWNGQQLIPENWVRESVALQTETEDSHNGHYGYQLWINNDREGSFAYNGMLGQNVFVYPDIDMVVVTNAGNKDIFQSSSMARRIRSRMKNDICVSDGPLPENFAELSRLKSLCKNLAGEGSRIADIRSGGWSSRKDAMTTGSSKRRRVTCGRMGRSADRNASDNRGSSDYLMMNRWMKILDGAEYMLKTHGVGLFPVMMQIVHNNFTDGIKSISFRQGSDGGFYIDIREGEAIFRLRCGFDGKRYVSSINMHGENYRLSVRSAFTRDEYNRIVLRNDITFLEEACLRTLNIYIDERGCAKERPEAGKAMSRPGTIMLRFTESPGSDMLVGAIKNITPDGSGFESVVLSKLFRGGMKEAITEAVKNTIQPTVYADINNPDLDTGKDNEPEADAKDSSLLFNSTEISGMALDNPDEDTEEDGDRHLAEDVTASTFEVAPEYDVESEYEFTSGIAGN